MLLAEIYIYFWVLLFPTTLREEFEFGLSHVLEANNEKKTIF